MDGQVLCNPPLPFWGLSQLEDDEMFSFCSPLWPPTRRTVRMWPSI